MQTLSSSQASPEVPINENFETLDHAAVYGKAHATTTGLTWGYYGGRWGGFAVAAGTLALTNAATNYVVVERATGAVTVATTNTNWNNSTDYARAYKLTTAGSVVTATEDHRAGPGGVHGSAGTSGVSPVGRHAVYVSAAAMQPSAVAGCAPLAIVATSANNPDILSLDFDTTTQEYAQFSLAMPKSWNRGTVSFSPIWSHAATATNFGVVWDLQAVAVSNDDPIAVAYGTAQTSTDTGGTTNDLYRGPESAAITIAGTPAESDMVFFRLSRVTGNGSDTMAIDARLHGVDLFITTEAATDA
ncbi:MAG: hypothetical protein IPM06_20295 [Rhizobiales bacterium]|nr:hypothetical protein [Hyphomicrobiales bacterium]